MRVAGSLAVMAALDLRLTALALVALPLYVWVVHRVEPALGPGVARGYRAEAAIAAAADDSFMGVRVVRAFGGEPQERERFRRTNDWAEREEYQRVALAGTVFPLGELLLQLGLLLVWAAGAWWVIGGSVSFGVLISFVGYLTLMWDQLGNAGAIVQNWIYGTNSMHRMARILTAQPTVPEPPEATPRTLRSEVTLKNVSFGYEPNKLVLHGVDLHAGAGEMIGLVGHTGAGKSTIVNLITRLYDADAGAVLIDGVDVRTIATRDLRRQIGIVLQDPYLFAGSVADNIRYAVPEADAAAITAAAEAAHAHDFIMRLPEGYDTVVGQGGHGLSGGAATAGDRPRAVAGPAAADSGRGHLLGGHRDRVAHPGGAEPAGGRPHHDRHCPSPVDLAPGASTVRVGAGARGRAWQPRRADGGRRGLSPAGADPAPRPARHRRRRVGAGR